MGRRPLLFIALVEEDSQGWLQLGLTSWPTCRMCSRDSQRRGHPGVGCGAVAHAICRSRRQKENKHSLSDQLGNILKISTKTVVQERNLLTSYRVFLVMRDPLEIFTWLISSMCTFKRSQTNWTRRISLPCHSRLSMLVAVVSPICIRTSLNSFYLWAFPRKGRRWTRYISVNLSTQSFT